MKLREKSPFVAGSNRISEKLLANCLERWQKPSFNTQRLFLEKRMNLRFRILVSDSGKNKAAIAIVALVSAVLVISYAATRVLLPNSAPTPTPSSAPTISPTPTSTLPMKCTPTVAPTPTSSANWIPTPTSNPPELTTQEKVRDSVMSFIKSNHPETAKFIINLVWTGGRATPPNLLGAETYMYYAKGWNFTINYPVVPNVIYNVTADYSAVSIGVPYRIIWEGTWQNEVTKETNHVFAQ